MTTIVWRDGTLAGDQRSTDDGAIMPGRYVKVFKNEKGWLYGSCGTSGPIEEFNRFMSGVVASIDPKKLPRGDYNGLVVSPNGDVFDIDRGYIEKLPSTIPYYVVGSGRKVALGALFMGASAEQAVRAAIEHDASTGGEVDVVLLK
jgi:ATP-dependent HslUV protease subunit HslV